MARVYHINSKLLLFLNSYFSIGKKKGHVFQFELLQAEKDLTIYAKSFIALDKKIVFNPSPAEPGYTLFLQTV